MSHWYSGAWKALVVALATAAVLALAVGSAGATPPSSNVQILLTENPADYAPIDWSATGLISDHGTWEKGLLTFHGSPHSPVFAGIVKTVETGSKGSFGMQFQGLGVNATGVFSGTWQISGGTGAYARLHGTGTWYADDSRAGITVFPCTGEVHFD